jgi:NAD(P)-dependent dehydrogenase (short-subunit alcohol dehydrogenase family)
MGVLDLFSLKRKVALVTGGAGRIVSQVVRALAEAAATVYSADLDAESVRALSEDLRQQGLDVVPVGVDQSNEASVLRLRDEILNRSGRIDILVNAAVARTMSGWQDDATAFSKSMETNATGLFVLTRTFGDVMEKQGGGSIIYIGSIQGMVGPDRQLYQGLSFHGFIPDYFFHKGGVINFTRFVASYYGPKRVRCNCISPGGIRSESTLAEFANRYGERTILGRMGEPLDLMGAVIFLASDASAYVTGANLVVDGGYSAI